MYLSTVFEKEMILGSYSLPSRMPHSERCVMAVMMEYLVGVAAGLRLYS